MLHLTKFRIGLIVALIFSSLLSLYFYSKANALHPVIFPAKSTFYTPGQHDNCKWVVHISDKITTEPGDNSSAQIGIPEVIKDGYIAGILQNGPGSSLLFAFKLPVQTEESPPIVMTASYTREELPLKKVRFRVFSSTSMTMVLYSSYEACIEAGMK